MDWNWVFFAILINSALGKEIQVQVNTKKWAHYLPERFLSMTVDPITIAAASPLTQESLNMAKGLSPSFIRIGGIGTNKMFFGKEFLVNGTSVTEEQWDSVNRFTRDTGLDLIVSLNPTQKRQGSWDIRNSEDLIAYSDHKGYKVNWQLGYDLYGTNSTGVEIGQDLVRLRKLLDEFPQFANTPVFGPDINSVFGTHQIHFMKDLLDTAGTAVGSIILQPKFKKYPSEEPERLMSSMMYEMDSFVWNRDGMKIRTPRKPIWMAESDPSEGTWKDAVSLSKKLGSAARLGVQVFMRHAGVNTLKSPTPDFWFSLLYKTLVGRGVLDTKMTIGNRSDVHVYSHCTPTISQDKSVLDTEWNYEKGAVTLFGVNESPERIKLNLKGVVKDEPIHMYVLTSSPSSSSDSVDATFLNGQELILSPTWDLPVLSPRVRRPTRSQIVTLPGNSIFFLVFPENKARTCTFSPVPRASEFIDAAKRVKILADDEQLEPEEPLNNESDQTFVKFTKKRQIDSEPYRPFKRFELFEDRYKNLAKILAKFTPKKMELHGFKDDEIPVKYITFNDNSWLNKLTEKMTNAMEKEQAERGETENKGTEKLKVLESVLKGKQDFSSEEDSSEVTKQRMKRFSGIEKAPVEFIKGLKKDSGATPTQVVGPAKPPPIDQPRKSYQVREEEPTKTKRDTENENNQQELGEMAADKEKGIKSEDQIDESKTHENVVMIVVPTEIEKQEPPTAVTPQNEEKGPEEEVESQRMVAASEMKEDIGQMDLDSPKQKIIDKVISKMIESQEKPENSGVDVDPGKLDKLVMLAPISNPSEKLIISGDDLKSLTDEQESPDKPKVARHAEPATANKETDDAAPSLDQNTTEDQKKKKSYEEYIKEKKEKMTLMRSRLKATREKWQEELKKAAASGKEEEVKSTIKRREAELKEFIKNLDKREAQLSEEIDAKLRPKRLSVSPDPYYEGSPAPVSAFKRSYEVYENQNYTAPHPPMGVQKIMYKDTNHQYLKPLSIRSGATPVGTYSHRMYPAQLLSMIESRMHPSMNPFWTNTTSSHSNIKVLAPSRVKRHHSLQDLVEMKELEHQSDYSASDLIKEKMHGEDRVKRSTMDEINDQIKSEVISPLENIMHRVQGMGVERQVSPRFRRTSNDLRDLDYDDNSASVDDSPLTGDETYAILNFFSGISHIINTLMNSAE